MSRRVEDPLAADIRYELMPGRFLRWDEVSRLVHNLDRVHEKVEGVVQGGEAERAVRLYEIFLSGVYAKIEEADDECDLAMLFHRLACGWIQARQAAGRPAEETVSQLLNWMKNDDYGFCNDIERDVIKVLDAQGRRLFIGHFQQLLEKATPGPAVGPARAIFEYENDLRLPAMSLKAIFESLRDVPSYAALCERLGFSPRGCEHLAKMEISRKHWAAALEWVEKGIALKPTRNWHNQDSYDLERLKPEILRRLGRKEDALAAAKLHRALGLRIVNAGKSKYYGEALEHFAKARDLYCGAGQAAEWLSVVEFVRTAHSRKSGFLSAFEEIVSGKSKRSPSYAEEAQTRWKRLTS
jgi:hypothetical protein